MILDAALTGAAEQNPAYSPLAPGRPRGSRRSAPNIRGAPIVRAPGEIADDGIGRADRASAGSSRCARATRAVPRDSRARLPSSLVSGDPRLIQAGARA